MASKLAAKAEHNLIIGIPMAAIVKKGFEDLPGMTAILESAIIEASNDPKQNKPRVKSDEEKKMIKLKKQVAALTAAQSPSTTRICVYFREEPVNGHTCVKGKDCKFIHDRSGQVCDAPEYAEYQRRTLQYQRCTASG